MHFRQIFVTGASWDKDELIRFRGQKVKGQGHIIAAEAYSCGRCRCSVHEFMQFIVD